MSQYSTFRTKGYVDTHEHMRDPGDNPAENYGSGTAAAVTSGTVALADMSNNIGCETWSVDAIYDKHDRIRRKAFCKVGVNAGSQPHHDNLGELSAMAEMALMLKSYATLTTGNDREYEADDFMPAYNIWHENTIAPIAIHPGANNLADFIGKVAGDLGHHLHVCHVGSSEHIKLIRQAKKDGLPVTAEATPHHMLMTSHETQTRSWYARMQPPLAHQEVAEEILYETELDEGVIDNIATDHAPHPIALKDENEKIDPHGDSGGKCFGVPNIEHMMAIFIRRMLNGDISEKRLEELTSTNPAKILGITLSKDTYVDWSLEPYRINEEETLYTGAGWTPYLGMLAVGKVEQVVINGTQAARRGSNGRTVPVKPARFDQVIIRGSVV